MHRLALAVALACLPSCNLFNTEDAENAQGRGPKAFDPYAGSASGALRLGLQYLNGCAILATGEPVGKGAANIPYPANCARYDYQDPVPPVDPAPPMPLLAGATYFLNQITLMDYVQNLHKDPRNMAEVATWMTTNTRFAALDWRNLSVISDEFQNTQESLGPDIYDHWVYFGNANWQLVKDDTFLLEVLDVDGRVRQSQVYEHSDFLAETPRSGHTQLTWINGSIGRPEFPGDLEIHPAPDPGINNPPLSATSYRTKVRIEHVTSTHPTKSFKLDPGLFGDGAIRLTWSQMPFDPFYFPVTFIRQQDLPPTCYKPGDTMPTVACDFGLVPEVTMIPPKNGKFYVPGEELQFRLAVKDGSGNYLHAPDRLPSYNDFLRQQSNGLLYFSFFHLNLLNEADIVTQFNLSGPRQNARPVYELADTKSFYQGVFQYFNTDLMAANAVPGLRDAPIPVGTTVILPLDAQPGTYTAFWKVNRQYLGERFTKITPIDFQVGQEQKTDYPGRVGNCQICHRGVISLDNVKHGLSVDYVEGCKTCHNRTAPFVDQFATQAEIHKIHMTSSKFPQQKTNCSFCHLTRESALRPSMIVCGSCHPQPHGTMFWDLQFQSSYDPLNRGVWTNCAEACHQQTPPTAHILPSQ
jgi:hypothetical protein